MIGFGINHGSGAPPGDPMDIDNVPPRPPQAPTVVDAAPTLLKPDAANSLQGALSPATGHWILGARPGATSVGSTLPAELLGLLSGTHMATFLGQDVPLDATVGKFSAQLVLHREINAFLSDSAAKNLSDVCITRLQRAKAGEGLHAYAELGPDVPTAIKNAWIELASCDLGTLYAIAQKAKEKANAQRDNEMDPVVVKALAKAAGRDFTRWYNFVSSAPNFSQLVQEEESAWLKAASHDSNALQKMRMLYRLRNDGAPSASLLLATARSLRGNHTALLNLFLDDKGNNASYNTETPLFEAIVEGLHGDKTGLVALHRALTEARIHHPVCFHKALGAALRGDAAATKEALGFYTAHMGLRSSNVAQLEPFVQELGHDKDCLLMVADTLYRERVELPGFLTTRLKDVLRGDADNLVAIFTGYFAAKLPPPTDLLPELLAALRGQTERLLDVLGLYSNADRPAPVSLVEAISASMRLG